MPSMKDENRGGERMVALFLFGMVLFNPLVVGIFDNGPESSLFGIPALYLYLFVSWAVLIGLIAVVAERSPQKVVRPPEPTHQSPLENQQGL